MRRDTKIVLAVGAAIPAAILALSLLATRLVASGASPRLRLLFRPLCHGIEQRCLELWGVAMPLCARCTAIYAGLLGGVLLFTILPLVRERAARAAAFAAAVPLAVDGLTQLTGLRESVNALRIATGLLAGLAFGFWMLTAVEHAGEKVPGRS